jgi:uncharacterized protein
MQSKLQMKNFVFSLLKNNISEYYYYHNYEHTLYVIEKALEIGRYEKCTEEELELLTTAALWHDTGYIKTYKDHEDESCKLSRLYLPEYGIPDSDIDKICGMIMATKIPQSPKNKLEEILADADLEYMGTATFEIKADNLFREMQFINPSLTEVKWNQVQISFLQKHHFFTRFCKENREPVKQIYLSNMVRISE